MSPLNKPNVLYERIKMDDERRIRKAAYAIVRNNEDKGGMFHLIGITVRIDSPRQRRKDNEQATAFH